MRQWGWTGSASFVGEAGEPTRSGFLPRPASATGSPVRSLHRTNDGKRRLYTEELALNPEKVCFIIVNACEWSAQYDAGSPTDASNPTDDGSQRTLSTEYGGSPEAEMRSFLEHLNEAELLDIYALSLVGRGTHEVENWRDALEDARAVQTDGAIIRRMLDTPLLADYLEEGLGAFGKSRDDYGPRSD